MVERQKESEMTNKRQFGSKRKEWGKPWVNQGGNYDQHLTKLFKS